MPDEIEITTSGEDKSEHTDSFMVTGGTQEIKKEDWVEKSIEYEATPKSLRDPKKVGDFISKLGVPSSTYYRVISQDINQEKIIKRCFKQAKKRTPEIVEKMGDKAEAGDNVSISQFMEYILEIKKRIDVTSGGEKIKQIYGGVSKCSGNEEDIQSQEEN